MVQIKLIKGLSYDGIVSATQKKPFVTTDEETANKAVETGYFAVVQSIGGSGNAKKPIAPAEKADDQTGEDDKKSFEKMTKAELEAYATENGVDISQCTNNKQRIDLIKKAEAEKIAAALSLDDDEEEDSENNPPASSDDDQTGEGGEPQLSGNNEDEGGEGQAPKVNLDLDE